MTYKEESYVLDTLKELKELIRSPTFKQYIQETHENNIMLKQICKFINAHLANANQENENDFSRNILANMISNFIENGVFNKK